jgi:2-phosphosulfolactate phosphatase
MTFNQSDFNIKLEWGMPGIEQLAPVSDVIIIVDVLSFSTSVDITVSRGAKVFPYRYKDDSAVEFAKSLGAELAERDRNSKGFTLSPASLQNIPEGTKLVLPSPNGSTLSLATGNIPTICGGLRNAKAVAEYAMAIGKNIGVIPAGEKWQEQFESGTIRFAVEDLIGAGAIVYYLKGSLSPESLSAKIFYENVKEKLYDVISNCVSGKELIERGFIEDVKIPCQKNVSEAVAALKGKCYERIE